MCLSVPTEVGCGGVRKQIELALTPKERLGLQNSARVLRDTINAVESRLAGKPAAEVKTEKKEVVVTMSGGGRSIPRAAWNKQ